MHIKKYIAPTVKDAIKAIKTEFGPDALILSTRRTRGPGGALFEVVAAVDYDLTAPVDVDLGYAAQPAARAGIKPPPPSTMPDFQAVSPGMALGKELKELKELKAFFTSVAFKGNTAASAAINGMKEEMVKNGIDRRLAEKILLKTFSGAPKGSIKADPGCIKTALRNKIFEKISVKDPLKEGGVFAFIGPTGVGKTTTIAKLAAMHALKKKRSVALLTMDTYRIAAAEQLKVYGRIIGVPVEVARTPKELDALIRMHADKEMILIDTAWPGRPRSLTRSYACTRTKR
ncbi:MAG: flagellar biosynthesis protein FlhF [Deltaproteobacteria bacterium]|nr:flagellar biosynthesis protein FlhF [Deltaproteobacteria bacterium]